MVAIDHDKARQRVIAITRQALSEGGLDAFNIRKVAKEAGISVGTVYNLFGDADDLLRVVNTELLDELGARGEAAVAALAQQPDLDVRGKLLALSQVYFDFVESNRIAWAAMLAFNRRIPSRDTPDWYLERQEILFDIIGTILHETDLRHDPERVHTAARALWSSVHGIVTNGYRGGDDAALRDSTWAQIDLLVTTFVKGLERS